MAADSEKNEKHAGKSPIIIDLGKRSPKKIKQLRRGKGELLDEVHECLDELAENGKINKAAQPVIVVVTEKLADRMSRSLLSAAAAMPFGGPLFVMPVPGRANDDDDDDDDEADDED